MAKEIPPPGTTTRHDRRARLVPLLIAYLKQASNAVPIAGPLVSGAFEVMERKAGDAEAAQLEQRITELLATGSGTAQQVGEIQDDLKVLTALAVIGFSQQEELLEWVRGQQERVNSTSRSPRTN